jgi:hypothetical protein
MQARRELIVNAGDTLAGRILFMSTKLSSTNPYLRDPATRKSMVIRSVVTSSAIEGIRASFKGSTRGNGKSSASKGRVKGKKA